jgi:hypothetical protein
MSTRVTCTTTGGQEALAKIQAVRKNLPAAARAIGKALILGIQRKSLDILTAKKSHLLRVELARFVAKQKIIYGKDYIEWGLPSGATEGGKPMSAIGLIQDRGGDIKPTGNNKMLRIPLPPALTAAGVDRYAGMDFHVRQPWSKAVRWFILSRGNRAPIIVEAKGHGKYTSLTPMYVLVPKATIKEKKWLSGPARDAKSDLPAAEQKTMSLLVRGEPIEEPT